MDNDKKSALNLLGIARRAGKLSLGFDSAEESVIKKKSRLIITASDISERTLSAFVQKAHSNNINMIASDIPMADLGAAVSRDASATLRFRAPRPCRGTEKNTRRT
ncbi:MAG: ribosomal L7Ae/L30e/S12e/Gadd45 family protein [Clostridia bacterium]|nr:ribosomal L7Ae/L30e/S12e/Gadd45 family protein [Clostridia bacterium]